MSAVAPVKRPARVRVTLKDSRADTQEVESHRDDFHRPFVEVEARGKFRELAGEVLSPEGVTAVEQAVDRYEDWESVGELSELLRRYGRPS